MTSKANKRSTLARRRLVTSVRVSAAECRCQQDFQTRQIGSIELANGRHTVKSVRVSMGIFCGEFSVF